MQIPKRVRIDLTHYRTRKSPSPPHKKHNKRRQQRRMESSPESPRTALEEQWAESHKKYRQSLEKVQETVLGDSRSSKQMTARTLKEVGKQAEKRDQMRRDLLEEAEMRRRAPIPKPYDFKVEMYGFRDEEKRARREYEQIHSRQPQQKKQIANKSNINRKNVQKQPQEQLTIPQTYMNFEQSYNTAIQKHTKQQREAIRSHEQHSRAITDISQQQIDAVVGLFEWCSRLNEQDTLSLADVYCALQQLQRRHLIQVLQKSQASQEEKDGFHRGFIKLLKQLQQQMKVVFCRKENQNIYDMLFHLSSTQRLQSATQILQKIQQVLPQ